MLYMFTTSGDLNKCIAAFESLEDNWDSHQGKPPSPKALVTLCAIVDLLATRDLDYVILPMPDGGIYAEDLADGPEDVLIQPDGTPCDCTETGTFPW